MMKFECTLLPVAGQEHIHEESRRVVNEILAAADRELA